MTVTRVSFGRACRSFAAGCLLAAGAAAQGPARYTVTSATDAFPAVPGTLRHALEAAESDGRASVVAFAPALLGSTISLVRTLPVLTEGGTTIDGTNGSTAVPRITLTPAPGQTASIANAMRFDSSQNVVRGLVMNGFQYSTVLFATGSANRLEASIIDGSNTGIAIDRTSHAGEVRGCTVRRSNVGIRISGARSIVADGRVEDSQSHSILVDANATDTVLERNAVVRAGATAIYLTGPRTRADGNTVDVPRDWGIRVEGPGCVLENNTVRDGPIEGILLTNVSSTSPATVGPGNLVERCAGQGLMISSSPNTLVVDNRGFRSNLGSGIRSYNSAGVRIAGNVEIAWNQQWGIDLLAQLGSCTVEGNTLHHNAYHGIDVGGITGFTFRGNTVRDHGNTGMQLYATANVLIEDNRFLDNGASGVVLHPGCRTVRFLRNEFARNFTGVTDFESVGTEYGWNRCHDQAGTAIEMAEGNAWLHDNLIWNNGLAGIETGMNRVGPVLVHNTIVGNAVGFLGDAEIWNCLFSANGIDLFPGSLTTVQGSLIENDAFGFVGSNGNFSADPQLVCRPAAGGTIGDTLHIGNRSPCIDRGRRGAPRTTYADIDGDPRPLGGAPDVGADESTHALDALPPTVSARGGATIALTLSGGSARAGNVALLLGSLSGTGPTPFGMVQVPLTFDVLFALTLQLAGTAAFPGFLGMLDANGEHAASLPIPAGALPSYAAGTQMTFAWIDLTTLDFASNPTCVEIVP